MKIGFSENFCNLKIFFKHFSINPIAKWTYGQNIENRATPPLRFMKTKNMNKLFTVKYLNVMILNKKVMLKLFNPNFFSPLMGATHF